MRSILLILTACLLPISTCLAQVQKLVTNKYWQYDHSHYDKNKKTVYTFKSIPLDSLKEVALYFDANGKFKEVTTQKHPKPARNGTWHVKQDTLVLNFPNQRWNYKIIFMSNKEFQCTMSK